MTAERASALYEGDIHHRRYHPKPHQFSYSAYMMYLDLDEIAEVLSLSRCCSESPWSPLSLRRGDFHGDPSVSIKQAIYDTVEVRMGVKLNGPVRMLANWRCFGFNFNPLVTYYCFDATGKELRCIVSEVTNTPWFERHAYIIPIDKKTVTSDEPEWVSRSRFEKVFTVSPFNPINMTYMWYSSEPQKSLSIKIENFQGDQKIFAASMTLNKKMLDSHSLKKTVLSFPFMAIKVVFAIYFEALKLFFKGVPFLGKDKIKNIMGE